MRAAALREFHRVVRPGRRIRLPGPINVRMCPTPLTSTFAIQRPTFFKYRTTRPDASGGVLKLVPVALWTVVCPP